MAAVETFWMVACDNSEQRGMTGDLAIISGLLGFAVLFVGMWIVATR